MNNYNDFPIFSGQEYDLLAHEYSKNINNVKEMYERKSFFTKIMESLSICKSFCLCPSKKINKHLLKSIELTLSKINQISDNINATLSIPTIQSKTINSFNIFSLLRALLQTIEFAKNILSNEDKEFIKNLAEKSISELLDCIKDLVKALEMSDIKLFKYM